jgi:hypothetical protein
MLVRALLAEFIKKNWGFYYVRGHKLSYLDAERGAEIFSSGVYMNINEQRKNFSNKVMRQIAKFNGENS